MNNHSDEAPALTAAEAWLETQLGRITLHKISGGPHTKAMLSRAFVAGYIIGQRAVIAAEGGECAK